MQVFPAPAIEHAAPWLALPRSPADKYAMRAVWQMAWKDLRLLLRDRTAVAFTFVLPLLYAGFFGAVFDGVGRAILLMRVELALVDEDQSPGSQALITQLQHSREIDLRVTNLAEAEDLVRHGKVAAYVRVPRGFGAQSADLFGDTPPELEIGVGPRREAEANMARALVTRQVVALTQAQLADPARLAAQLEKRLADLGNDPAKLGKRLMLQGLIGMLRGAQPANAGESSTQPAASLRLFQPVKIEARQITLDEHRPDSAFDVTVPQGVIWGVISCAAGFGVTLARERQAGTYLRLCISPLGSGTILAGKALACFLTIAIVTIGMLLIATVALGVTPDSPWLLLPGAVSMAVMFTGLMMLLAVVVSRSAAAGGTAWGILLVIAVSGGAIVPVYLMPPWLKAVSAVSPARWALVAFEGPIWREFASADMVQPCTILLAVGGACFTLGALLLPRRGG